MRELPSSPLRVLVVEDDRNIRLTLQLCLDAMGCDVLEATSRKSALAALGARVVDLALLDMQLGTENGLDILSDLLSERPTLQVVMMSASTAIDAVVEAIRRGARDYLPKPFTPSQIRIAVEGARARLRVERELLDLRFRVADGPPSGLLMTDSPRMRSVLDVVARAAGFEAPVLLRGENGTGKRELARALHALSPRRDRLFVVVNCATLSEELLTSELFGHATGASTGAVCDQLGRVEAANGGTLFFDEIGELPPPLQARLLRFLRDRKFERVGESRTRSADVRIVAATNRDLHVAVQEGRFREDLMYRLNAIEVEVPALRERKEDILPLASAFAAMFAHTARRPVPSLSPEGERILLSHTWPGNVRELRNTMERAIILTTGASIAREALAGETTSTLDLGPTLGGDFPMEQIEREHILRVLARAGSFERAARVLALDVSTLWRKRKRYGQGASGVSPQ